MPDDVGAAPIPVVELALAGLTAARKTLPPALLYDEAGCALFSRITRLPEYYPTRTEMALLPNVASALAAHIAPGATLVEFGTSDEAKAAFLFAALDISAYVPIDVAAPALAGLVSRMRASHPAIAVHPLAADFMDPITLPHAVAGAPRLGFFPGSTIGNLDPGAAAALLRRIRTTLGPQAPLLIGVDLEKPLDILLPAYDDAEGVTAAFNLNLLHRLNREAGADFDPDLFQHRAVWNEAERRIEMHLESRIAHTVEVAGQAVRFAEGETIHTENSYKYNMIRLDSVIRSAGWHRAESWMDPARLFSVHLLA